MAKKNTLHPNYKLVEVTQTDGSTYTTRSTYHNSTIRLEVDSFTHPAWTKAAGYVDSKAGEVQRFNQRFGGLKFLDGNN